MLAHEFTYCVGVPGGSAEVSLNGLRAILGQVEAELYQSEIYGQMLSSLRALPDDLTRQVQCLVRAVGREAIRLALRKLVRKKPSVMVQAGQGATLPMAAPKLLQPPAPPPPNANLNAVTAPTSDRDRSATIAPVSSPDSQPTHLLNGRVTVYPPTATPKAKQLSANPPKKLSKKELAVQAALQARETCLQELGQVMRQARQEKAWSPYHLHIKTQIPVHQLEALERGRIDRLPEDVYLRGFIRQVGNALGLDGSQMAASLPTIATATAVLPSWQQPKTHIGLHLNSMPAYLGYAALMASGIAWVSHQSPHQTAPMPATVIPLPDAPAPTTAKTNQKAALNSKQSAGAPRNISSPERSPL